MPQGYFYVVARAEWFVYKKQGDEILEVEWADKVIDKIDYGNGTLTELFKHFQKLAGSNAKRNAETSVNVIFFNRDAYAAFDPLMQKAGFHLAAIIGAKRIDDTREIRYYTYLPTQ